jgi:hypothetical protein
MSTSAFPLATDPHFINAFYLGLLAVAAVHRVSPLSAPGRAALLPPPLFDAPRGVRWLARLSSLRINAVLRTVRAVTVALWAWCCVAQSEAAAVQEWAVEMMNVSKHSTSFWWKWMALMEWKGS